MSESSWVSDAEIEKLVLSLAIGTKSFTQEQAEALCGWAEMARVNATMLNMILGGQLVVTGLLPDGSPVCKSPAVEKEMGKMFNMPMVTPSKQPGV